MHSKFLSVTFPIFKSWLPVYTYLLLQQRLIFFSTNQISNYFKISRKLQRDYNLPTQSWKSCSDKKFFLLDFDSDSEICDTGWCNCWQRFSSLDTIFVLDVTPWKYHMTNDLISVELAMIMDRLYGGVCYAGIDTDPELKYPKGAGRVAFSNQQSYIAAISARFVQLQHGDIDKRVEVKPYVLDDQMCDECQGQRCGGKFAPFFCANVTCLQVRTFIIRTVPICLLYNFFKL